MKSKDGHMIKKQGTKKKVQFEEKSMASRAISPQGIGLQRA